MRPKAPVITIKDMVARIPYEILAFVDNELAKYGLRVKDCVFTHDATSDSCLAQVEWIE